MATASDADSNVHSGELVQAKDEEGFVDLFGFGCKKAVGTKKDGYWGRAYFEA